jgi:hypothetical protein
MSPLLVFNRVLDWRFRQSCWYFQNGFVNYCPSNLLSSRLSPPPLPYVNKYPILYTRQWVRGVGEYGDIGEAAKSLYKLIFLDNDILHCFLSV